MGSFLKFSAISVILLIQLNAAFGASLGSGKALASGESSRLVQNADVEKTKKLLVSSEEDETGQQLDAREMMDTLKESMAQVWKNTQGVRNYLADSTKSLRDSTRVYISDSAKNLKDSAIVSNVKSKVNALTSTAMQGGVQALKTLNTNLPPHLAMKLNSGIASVLSTVAQAKDSSIVKSVSSKLSELTQS